MEPHADDAYDILWARDRLGIKPWKNDKTLIVLENPQQNIEET